MKKILFTLFSAIIMSCSNSNNEDPSDTYVGQYYFVKNIAKIDGVVTSENNHEGACSGRSNYLIKSDNQAKYEVWGANAGKCSLLGTYTYTYNPETKKNRWAKCVF
ncbi:hypothetical protein [Chryseobacterium proteolyticum]|uniref:hypothetical protein n=1 Tax=Chryseobacterium proteolyticum TaxID=118127 RepID=UPI003983B5E6